jgi:hypothetical protein
MHVLVVVGFLAFFHNGLEQYLHILPQDHSTRQVRDRVSKSAWGTRVLKFVAGTPASGKISTRHMLDTAATEGSFPHQLLKGLWPVGKKRSSAVMSLQAWQDLAKKGSH